MGEISDAHTPAEDWTVEHRFRAVVEVLDGAPIAEVARRYGTSRQSLHTWLRRFREGGRDGLKGCSRRPNTSPSRVAVEVELVICQLRQTYPKWGARRIAHELTALMSLTEAEVNEDRVASNGYNTTSLDSAGHGDSDEGETALADFIGEEDPALDLMENFHALAPLIAELGERDRYILHLRFVEKLTQSQIGERLNAHVSRLLGRLLTHLRKACSLLTDPPVGRNRARPGSWRARAWRARQHPPCTPPVARDGVSSGAMPTDTNAQSFVRRRAEDHRLSAQRRCSHVRPCAAARCSPGGGGRHGMSGRLGTVSPSRRAQARPGRQLCACPSLSGASFVCTTADPQVHR